MQHRVYQVGNIKVTTPIGINRLWLGGFLYLFSILGTPMLPSLARAVQTDNSGDQSIYIIASIDQLLTSGRRSILNLPLFIPSLTSPPPPPHVLATIPKHQRYMSTRNRNRKKNNLSAERRYPKVPYRPGKRIFHQMISTERYNNNKKRQLRTPKKKEK